MRNKTKTTKKDSWRNKQVLITGIGGFVGPYLAEYLIGQGANIFGFDLRRADGTKPKNLTDKKLDTIVQLVEGDLVDISSIASAIDIAKPDVIFHLAGQSYVKRSFEGPIETIQANVLGTANLLEAVRMKELDPIIVFAGSSEEHGLIFYSEKQYQNAIKKYKTIFPLPEKFPEIPTKETDPLRPMSPYAVTKVACDYLMRNYFHSFGLKTIVSRAFNHEGASRGLMFVTSVITNQVMKLKYGEIDKIFIGDVGAFRDWSHVKDIVRGYALLAEKGRFGDVYIQGSMRTNSVLSYILLGLENAGWQIKEIKTLNKRIRISRPTEKDNSEKFGIKFLKTKVDKMMLEDKLIFDIKDKGITVITDKGEIPMVFDPARFRPAEIPILLSDSTKIKKLGFKVTYSLEDIIRDQLNYYLKKENRK